MSSAHDRKMEPAELEEWCAIALKHINRQPGLNEDRLGIILGFNPTRPRKDSRVRKVVTRLIKKGLIRTEREQFSSKADPLKLFPVDYQPPQKRPLFQARGQQPVKTWVDPSYRVNHLREKKHAS